MPKLNWYTVGSAMIAFFVSAVGVSVWLSTLVVNVGREIEERRDESLGKRIDGVHRRVDDLKSYVDNEDGSLVEMDRTISDRINAMLISRIAETKKGDAADQAAPP